VVNYLVDLLQTKMCYDIKTNKKPNTHPLHNYLADITILVYTRNMD